MTDKVKVSGMKILLEWAQIKRGVAGGNDKVQKVYAEIYETDDEEEIAIKVGADEFRMNAWDLMSAVGAFGYYSRGH